jgi:FSR family fosmidomycin resistance protein-like MFS transporter
MPITPRTTGSSVVETPATQERVAYRVLGALSVCHLLNDTMQSLIPAVYPILKTTYHLDFGQVGLITLSSQMTASLLQPVVGLYTDKRPMPYSLAIGMGFTLAGLLLISTAPTFAIVLAAVALVGMGSSVFHPESSRVARMASGGQHGLAQSLFQVGGNAGTALGPLLAAYIVLPQGQKSIGWFSVVALVAMAMLARIGAWYKAHRVEHAARASREATPGVPKRQAMIALTVLIALVFSKFFYMVSLNTFYEFYLMGKFHLDVRAAQIDLFIFLGAVAVGTIIGGPVGDRMGRKRVIWWSILGPLPFTLLLPYASLFWTICLTVIIGLLLASAFPAIIVYAQELFPGRVGAVSGLFFGLAFGMAGVGAALLGKMADATSIETVYRLCAFLPAIGLLAAFLPNLAAKESQ